MQRIENAVIIKCYDPRTDGQRHELRNRFIVPKRSDIISFAGASHTLAKMKFPSMRSFFDVLFCYIGSRIVIWYSIRLAIKLHNIKRVVITTHVDCGFVRWTGQSFQSNAEENHCHHSDQEMAAARVHKWFPNLEIVTCLVYFDEQGLCQLKDYKVLYESKTE